MLGILQIVAVVLVGLVVVPSLAHGLELPGKMRLRQEAYLAVQTIYYPGFTLAGIAEPLALISTIVLLLLVPPGTADFWLTLGALIGLIGVQEVYWLVTHPVNRRWLQGEKFSGVGSGFFSFTSASQAGGHGQIRPVSWTELRDRWEYSHVARAVLAVLSLISLVLAVS
jgi:hypothetical protein